MAYRGKTNICAPLTLFAFIVFEAMHSLNTTISLSKHYLSKASLAVCCQFQIVGNLDSECAVSIYTCRRKVIFSFIAQSLFK